MITVRLHYRKTDFSDREFPLGAGSLYMNTCLCLMVALNAKLARILIDNRGSVERLRLCVISLTFTSRVTVSHRVKLAEFKGHALST